MRPTYRDRASRPNLRPGSVVATLSLIVAVAAATLGSLPARAEDAYAWTLVTKTNPPATMHPGQAYPLTVVLKNAGTETWNSEELSDGFHPVRLGTVGPRDRASAFATEDAAWLWSGGRRIRMETPQVPPGQYAVFTFTFTAPLQAGSYPPEQFAPLAEGVAWMDAATIVFPGVTVRPVVGAAPPLPAVSIQQPPCTPSAPKTEGPRAPSYQDAGPPAASLGYGSGSPVTASLASPSAVAYAANGDVLIADTANHRVVRMRPNGTVLKTWGTPGSDAGQMITPRGIAATANGFVFVSDSGNNRIQIWTLFGIYVGSFGSGGTGPGEFSDPRGISIVPDGALAGALVVADTGNNRIQIVTTSGAVLRTIGAAGTDPGLLSAPSAASAYRGMLYVADTANDRVQRFTLDGEPAGRWGGSGTADGCMSSPRGIVAGIFGVFVSDSGNGRLQHFARNGALVEQWGEPGTEAGRLSGPSGIAVEPGGAVWATEADGARAQRFAPGAEAAPAVPCTYEPSACAPSA